MPRLQLRALAADGPLRTLLIYSGAAVLSIAILFVVFKLWKADLRVPFSYSGDALIYSMVIKGTVEHGWYLRNDSVGAPTGLRMHDYPFPDSFNFLLIKLLSLTRAEYGWVLNVFFLLTFPLTTLCSMFAFRQFKLSALSAVVWSLLYTFIPSHFFRGQSHLFLATYYTVPLAVTVALWISTGALFSDGSKTKKHWLGLNLRSRKLLISIIVCLLVSSVGFVYYAFFSCFFILIAGVTAAYARGSIRHLLLAVFLVAVVFGGLLANLAPNLIYLYEHGEVNVTQRSPAEAEVYALKLAPMLLPISGHRLSRLAALTEKYAVSTSSNESGAAALGLFGSVGFLVLLSWLFFIKPDASNLGSDGVFAILNHLSIMNAAAVLLATLGGFSSLFALLISPQIRTYNRISIYIAFFSLLAAALLLEKFFRNRATSLPQALFPGLLALILVVGVLDQTSKRFVPTYESNKAEFRNDAEFVSSIAHLAPAGAMIFQLPYVPFPEQPAVNRMTDYSLFKGYLHSQNLRWSYGAMKGREGDLWLKHVSAQPVDQMLEAISVAGFKGIYIDRFGYQDEGAEIETKLKDMIGKAPLVSSNKRLVYFDLTEFSDQIMGRYSPDKWALKRDLIMQPLVLAWGGGFSGLEGTVENNWRWCSSAGELNITNPSQQVRKILVEMQLFSGFEEPANIRVESKGFSEALHVDNQGKTFSKVITILPGKSTIGFYCDGKRIIAPQDSRILVFKVANFNWKEI